ncbi:hypothetical protein, partial [Arthrobacter sp. SDTb3-6]|uniref:hypothetical protein n=1 Tax=Arthrobacter sp. SDTb3-6 TaxID=2713571 RepID=UPI00210B01F7
MPGQRGRRLQGAVDPVVRQARDREGRARGNVGKDGGDNVPGGNDFQAAGLPEGCPADSGVRLACG